MDAIRTENWGRYHIGNGEPLRDYCLRMRGELEQLQIASRIQWSGRREWSTHTSPGGCWICDAIGAIAGALRTLEEYGGLTAEITEEDRKVNIG